MAVAEQRVASSDVVLPEWLKKLYPFESRFQEIPNSAAGASPHRMHYIDEGDAAKPCIIMVHGNPTWSFYFRNLIIALRDSYRVIAIDHIGCGLSVRSSDNASGPIRAAERATHLEHFIDALGIKKFSLIMHDWGGPLGTALACRRIESVEKIVYFNTTLTEVDSLPGIIRRANNAFIGPLLTKYTRHFLKLMCRFGVHKKLSADVIKGYLYPYRSVARRQAIWDFVEDIPFDSDHPTAAEMDRFGRGLPELSARVPIQIIWGLNDPCFHREMLRRVAGHFPRARVLELLNAGHLVLEDETELCCATIKEFFSGTIKIPAKTNDAVNPIYAAFQKISVATPRNTAVVVPEFISDHLRSTKVTFSELKSLVTQYERGLLAQGLGPRDRVLMLCPPGIDFLALSLAVMGRGAVPVYVDPGIGKEKLIKCIADASPDAFIGSPKAHLLRLIYRKLFKRLKFSLVVTDFPFVPGATTTTGSLRRFSDAPIEPEATIDDTAMVAFTSGATGAPKGVEFSNEMLAAQLEIFARDFGFKQGSLDLPLLTIFSLYNVALGVGSVFLANLNPGKPLDLNPREVLRIIKDLGVRSSFGSPTLWDKISRYAETTRTPMEPLESIMMAGVAVPRAVRLRLAGLLPKSGMSFTPYGATEALPVTQISSAQLEEHKPETANSGEQGVYVGQPVTGIRLKIIPVTNGAIEQLSYVTECSAGEIGEVIVAGPSVSKRYLSRPEANLNGKIPDGATIWHRMGDCGYLGKEGGLYFCGRVAHRQVFEGRALFAVPTEQIFASHGEVNRAALVGISLPPQARADGRPAQSPIISSIGVPAIVIEPFAEHFPRTAEHEQRLRVELTALAKSAGLPKMEIFFHPRFPVDGRHNAKVFNDQLGVWASSELAKRSAVKI